MAGVIVVHQVHIWASYLGDFHRRCFTAFMDASRDNAAPVLPATLYDSMPVYADMAVFMRLLLPKFETAWIGVSDAEVHRATGFLTRDVDEWLGYALMREGTTFVKFIGKCLDALNQHEVMQFLPAVSGFDFSMVTTLSALLGLSMQVKLPLAMASVVFLSRARMQNDHPDDNMLPSKQLAQDLMNHLRTCFLFDKMLCDRAQVWGMEQDRQLELQRRSMVDSALDMRRAAAAVSEPSTAVQQMRLQIASLSRQLDEATRQVEVLQQRLQRRFG
eukprot:gene8900-9077_t